MKQRPNLELAWECRVVRPGEWSQALGCWFGQSLAPEQLHSLYFQLENEAGLADGMWAARRDGSIDAVAWIIPGATSYVHCWPLRCSWKLSDDLKQVAAGQLWHAVAAEYKSHGARFFQSNVPIQCQADIQQMKAVGFNELARILRMKLPLSKAAPAAQVDLLQLEKCEEDWIESFVNMMVESMTDGLDVPELNRFHSIEEVAAQYHKPGVNRFFIRHRELGNIGVIAMVIDDEQGLIRYLGLIPSERCKGWGTIALKQAVSWLQLQGCDKVELRVDARNTPALALYNGIGFQKVEEESMMIFS